MAKARPVVVYAASGYTGKLVQEGLAHRGLPFIAAGRNQERLEASIAEVPGTDAEARQVDHDVAALTKLFEQAKVVVNVCGPFGQLGETVIQAALAAGCHYVDTTGEQDFMVRMKRKYHAPFAEKNLLLAPACAWMWTAGGLAAEIALETPGIDELDIVYHPNGIPTIASTMSFLRMICRTNYRLDNDQLVPWEPHGVAFNVSVPGVHEIQRSLPWGGGAEPVWYEGDTRVRRCRVLNTVPAGPGTDFLLGCVAQYVEAQATKSDAELEQLTNSWGTMISSTPPREDLDVNRYIISCWGRGRTTATNVVLQGVAPYIQTGHMCADAARWLLDGKVKEFGFQAPAKVFGARDMLASLAELGLSEAPPPRRN